jgi:hypothetical protein
MKHNIISRGKIRNQVIESAELRSGKNGGYIQVRTKLGFAYLPKIEFTHAAKMYLSFTAKTGDEYRFESDLAEEVTKWLPGTVVDIRWEQFEYEDRVVNSFCVERIISWPK